MELFQLQLLDLVPADERYCEVVEQNEKEMTGVKKTGRGKHQKVQGETEGGICKESDKEIQIC